MTAHIREPTAAGLPFLCTMLDDAFLTPRDSRLGYLEVAPDDGRGRAIVDLVARG